MRTPKAWIADKLFNWLFAQEPAMQVVKESLSTGDTPEDQLKFWNDLSVWFSRREGQAYQLLMQKQFEALYDDLMKMPLSEKNDRSIAILTARIQESSRVMNFPFTVRQRVKALQAHIKVRKSTEGQYA